MKVSYNWLQSFFETAKLPPVAKVVELLTFHAFEVDSVESVGGDQVLDVKVLPNRAHDCLSHWGIAKELAAILKWPLPARRFFEGKGETATDRRLEIGVRDNERCRRYLGRVIENITLPPTPEWLGERLKAVGQRSVNALVDAANFVMFDLGQPLHVFDADKVEGQIRVRLAEKEESIITLDNKEIFLTRETLVIADELGPLAIAGIKGGQRAEVAAKTKNIIIEAANFQAGNIRQTSLRLGLRTEASKRFENDLSPEVVKLGMEEVTTLIAHLLPGQDIKVGPLVDVYPKPPAVKKVSFTASEIEKILGFNLPETEIIDILGREDIKVAKQGDILLATPPSERLDLEGAEDIAEEVGRLYGYEHVEEMPLSVFKNPGEDSQELAYADKLREILVGAGFSEGTGYVFTAAGEVALANPLASDKNFLRSDLLAGLKERSNFNRQHLLFDSEAVRLFVVGKVFAAAGESLHLAWGIDYRTKPKDLAGEGKKIWAGLAAALGIKLSLAEILNTAGLVVAKEEGATAVFYEINVGVLAGLPQESAPADLAAFITNNQYQPISPFPRIIRDLAVWVPPEVSPVAIMEKINNMVLPDLNRGPILFDVFEKKNIRGEVERKSLAFRMVFQSPERTLSDEEINKIMDQVSAIFDAQPDWEVRK